jgi:hypothetical protein
VRTIIDYYESLERRFFSGQAFPMASPTPAPPALGDAVAAPPRLTPRADGDSEARAAEAARR